MTSSDVRDVLNLPEGVAGPRTSKKQRVSAPKPNLKGLAREVLNLGGDNPIAIVPEVTQFKKRRLANRKPAAQWELRPFINSARQDRSLVLLHWRRKETEDKGEGQGEGRPQETAETKTEDMEDSAFAKYNVQVSVPQYSDDQYRQCLQNDDWTKEETDYLMETVRDFEIRWPIIWDRYEWHPPATNGEADVDGDESKAVVPTARSRSMEDLKARYYEVASKMMAAQKPVQCMTQAEFSLHESMANFKPQQEKARKDFALKALSRSREEAREEESLLLEIKRILARSERFNDERRELYHRLDYPRSETDISSFKSSAGLQTLLQNLMSADKSKKRKSIMGTDGVSPGVAAGTQGPAQETGRRDSTVALAANHRDSTGAPPVLSGGNRKSQQLPPQLQLPERRKLNGQEEAIYGVTHYDRLGSGPTFRTEKINKLFSHKSNQQQIRSNNALNELDVPSKLAMATAATTSQYEQLLAAVNGLLEARKLSDKLDAEIKLEQAKKVELEKALRPSPEPGQEEEEAANDEANGGAGGQEPVANPHPAKSDAGNQNRTLPGEGDGNKNAGEKRAQARGQKIAEEGGNNDVEREKGAVLGSRAISHKRSASVLSTGSDKSAKRQKK